MGCQRTRTRKGPAAWSECRDATKTKLHNSAASQADSASNRRRRLCLGGRQMHASLACWQLQRGMCTRQ
jgi:hypothetical protein